MSCAIASSSRSVLRAAQPRSISANHTRSVVHHARPPRIPVLPSPHNPKVPSPTPGTSTPQAQALPDFSSSSRDAPSRSSSSPLQGTNLTFHHAPPPTVPSYTTGSVPPLLRWVNGQPVQLTGEEAAPRRQERRGDGSEPRWDGGQKREMIEMRQRGMSRSQIAKKLSIPPVHVQHISRVAPLSTEQQGEKQTELDEQKSAWGFNKRLARAKREKRRELW